MEFGAGFFPTALSQGVVGMVVQCETGLSGSGGGRLSQATFQSFYREAGAE